MTSGVVYFNRGTGCYIRLLVSLYSLRRHYAGRVAVLQEGKLKPWIRPFLRELGADLVELKPSGKPLLVQKASLWQDTPYDCSMYLDSDTLVMGPVEPFLEWTATHGFVATRFNDWRTDLPRMRQRIEEWSKVAPELIEPAIRFGPAINSGVQGWTRQAAILPPYEELTARGAAGGCWNLLLDEIALQLLLPHHAHHLTDSTWNVSGKFGKVERANIIHYHGRKHCLPDNPRCDHWKRHYRELVQAFPHWREQLVQSWGDRRLAEFQAQVDFPAGPAVIPAALSSNLDAAERAPVPRADMTIVTAMDPAFAPKLQKNLQSWMETPGLREQQFLVFVNGFHNPEEHAFLDQYPNVTVVPWDYPHPDASRREFMLAAFVFGAARCVKTPYWMKLDADCAPIRSWWEWPDYQGASVTSHRWAYTKMKCNPGDSEHWFNRLDTVFRPVSPYFQTRFNPQDELSHEPGNPHGLPLRWNSFCHIESTAFTRRMADYLTRHNHGRLPVPTHDTTGWYCATIWQEPVRLVNMGEWFSQ